MMEATQKIAVAAMVMALVALIFGIIALVVASRDNTRTTTTTIIKPDPSGGNAGSVSLYSAVSTSLMSISTDQNLPLMPVPGGVLEKIGDQIQYTIVCNTSTVLDITGGFIVDVLNGTAPVLWDDDAANVIGYDVGTGLPGGSIIGYTFLLTRISDTEATGDIQMSSSEQTVGLQSGGTPFNVELNFDEPITIRHTWTITSASATLRQQKIDVVRYGLTSVN